MAINPVSSIYKSLNFGGHDSRDYGVYITGSGVFNSPERDGEMLVIPGRNGAFWQDNGRFQNIEVTYPAGCFGNTESDFAEAISDFRNMLCAQDGYVKLTDDYYPDEYRMAVYKSGLEVAPSKLVAGEFSITFECKPQRFLNSGETAITINPGDSPYTLTNPTLFDSQPLIMTYGEGEMEVNGKKITVTPAYYGYVELDLEEVARPDNETRANIINTSVYEDGNTISLVTDKQSGYGGEWFIQQVFKTPTTAATGAVISASPELRITPRAGSDFGWFNIKLDKLYFTAGSTTTTRTLQYQGVIRHAGASPKTFTSTIQVLYDGAEKRFDVICSVSGLDSSITNNGCRWAWRANTAAAEDSTVPVGGNPTYIDLESGEAYEMSGQDVYPVNDAIILPAQLPVLTPGDNTITFTGFSKVEIKPRWWKV